MQNTNFTAIRLGLAEQGRVIHALLLREILTTFGKRSLGFIWALIEPCLHILLLVIIKNIIGSLNPYGIDITLFLITGLIPFFLFRNALLKTMNAYNANRALLVFSQVKLFDIYIARGILEFALHLTILTILLTIAYLSGRVFEPSSILGIIYYLFAALSLGMGFGFLLAPLLEKFPSTQTFVQISLKFLYLISGIFFAPSILPGQYHDYFALNPMLVIIESLRSQTFIEYGSYSTFTNTTYIWYMIGSLWLIGLIIRKNSFLTR